MTVHWFDIGSPAHWDMTAADWRKIADVHDLEVAALKAVFEVEASGKFFTEAGGLPRRFEPHVYASKTSGTFDGETWDWRKSLRISESRREELFAKAVLLNQPLALQATSWGAPQIMGYHADNLAKNEVAMISDMMHSAQKQVAWFAFFCEKNSLLTHIRSHDWYRFARGYNGPGQPHVYAEKIAAAYALHSGKRSRKVLRIGARGDDVLALQVSLKQRGYQVAPDGIFGNKTEAAVRAFQKGERLRVDGVVGAKTQAALKMKATPQKDANDRAVDAISGIGAAGGLTAVVPALTAAGNLAVVTQIILAVAVVAVVAAFGWHWWRSRNDD